MISMLYARISACELGWDLGRSAGILNPVLTRLGLVVPGVPSSSLERPASIERLVGVSFGRRDLRIRLDLGRRPTLPAPGVAKSPCFEAYPLLGALALRTRSARLGALVTGVTTRAPALLGKAGDDARPSVVWSGDTRCRCRTPRSPRR